MAPYMPYISVHTLEHSWCPLSGVLLYDTCKRFPCLSYLSFQAVLHYWDYYAISHLYGITEQNHWIQAGSNMVWLSSVWQGLATRQIACWTPAWFTPWHGAVTSKPGSTVVNLLRYYMFYLLLDVWPGWWFGVDWITRECLIIVGEHPGGTECIFNNVFLLLPQAMLQRLFYIFLLILWSSTVRAFRSPAFTISAHYPV